MGFGLLIHAINDNALYAHVILFLQICGCNPQRNKVYCDCKRGDPFAQEHWRNHNIESLTGKIMLEIKYECPTDMNHGEWRNRI